MPQYQYTVSVTSGSATVTVPGVDITSDPPAKGDQFAVETDGEWYFLASDPAFDGTDSTVQLTTPYGGDDSAATLGLIQTGHTDDGFPVTKPGNLLGTSLLGRLSVKVQEAFDRYIKGVLPIDFSASGDQTLTADQARYRTIKLTGSASGNVVVPLTEGMRWTVDNQSSLDRTILVSGQTGVTVPAGKVAEVRCGASDVEWATGYIGDDARDDVRDYFGLKYEPSVQPTLLSDFSKNRHELYGQYGNEVTDLTTLWTTDRNSEKTYYDPAGVLRTAAANEPTITFDPETGEALGISAHEERTNLALNSENLSAWTGTAAVTSGAYTLGDLSLDLLTDDDAGAGEPKYNDVTIADDTSIRTMSIFVRQYDTDNAAQVVVNLKNGTTETFDRFNVDFDAGSATHVTSNVGELLGFEPLADGVYRMSVAITNNGTGNTVLRTVVYPAVQGGVSDTGSAYAGGHQVEEGATASPYIKTVASQVTRLADNVSRTLGGEWNPREGTLFVEFYAPRNNKSVQTIAHINGGGATNRWEVERNPTQGIRVRHVENSTGVEDMSVTLVADADIVDGELYRIATTIDGGTLIGVANGGAPLSVAITANATLTEARIGSGVSGANRTAALYVVRAKYIPRALSAAELQEMTRL